jgi:hypothetical protein
VKITNKIKDEKAHMERNLFFFAVVIVEEEKREDVRQATTDVTGINKKRR